VGFGEFFVLRILRPAEAYGIERAQTPLLRERQFLTFFAQHLIDFLIHH
jgi:hypothetical protein